MTITLDAGDRAPDFDLLDQDGKRHRLADYRGRTVVLYFYPRDDTSGCTIEACSFRDVDAELLAAGTVVLGVSTDDADSHRRFRAKHDLGFALLVDEGAQVATAYGAWGEKVLYGRRFVGMVRSTFIIGPTGQLLRVWKRARAKGHGEAVLAAIHDISTKSGSRLSG
jgi:peroxiredoxin Q/BCP